MSNPKKILSVAKSEVGYHEGKSGGHWNNKEKYAAEVPGLAWADYQPWCATFVAWCALQGGVASLYPKTASCEAGVAWFKARGRFSEYPAIGAQVFYGKGGGTHTGLVYAYDATYIFTVEGNTNDNGSAEGDGVYKKRRVRRDAFVYGYGYPKFSEGIKSADPKFAKEAPKPPAKKPAKPSAPSAPAKPPTKPVKPTSKLYKLSPAVKPGVHHVQVKDIQNLLLKLGYKIPGAVTDFYGPNTQAAVAGWLNKNTKYRSKGVRHDVRIGPAGYIALQKQCGRR